MWEFLTSCDPVSFGTGVLFSYLVMFIGSGLMWIDSKIELNYWMIRLKRVQLGTQRPTPLWVRIKQRFCKK